MFSVLGFGFLLLIISPLLFIGAQILLLKRRRFKYAILLLCPVVFVYLYNFTNAFYCLECIVTFNSPRITEWDNNYERIYVYNCFENTEEQVYWFFDQIANLPSGKVFTNMQAVNSWDGISHDNAETDYFNFTRFAGVGTYTYINITPKGSAIYLGQQPYQSLLFEDSIICKLVYTELDFITLHSILHFIPSSCKTKEHFAIIWKNMEGKTLLIMRYFNYGEYFKVEFPNRKK